MLINKLEEALYKGGLQKLLKSNKALDDFLLTEANEVRAEYKSCNLGVAKMMVDLANIQENDSVLEPGAGEGVILSLISKFQNHSYCEINKKFHPRLLKISPNKEKQNNFLLLQKRYDKIIINPPFAFNQYQPHIIHSYSLLKTNGVLVALLPANALKMPRTNKALLKLLNRGEIINVGNVCGETTTCCIFKATKI